MDLLHYDLDSLVYLSTDIVIANVSIDSAHRLTVSVTESLYGSLQSGDTLDTLSEFLNFFQPMEDRQRIILFLDRRPHPEFFLHPEASKSPFVVPPSGVYLVDAYKHVHQYYQPNNPGPYVAEGYTFFIENSVPTKEQDLALPSLVATRLRIADALQSVRPLRPLLDKTANREDVPALLSLLDVRAREHSTCGPDAILERLGKQLRSIGDPEVSLRSYSISPDWISPIEYVNHGGNSDQDFTAGRVRYLIRILAGRKRHTALRVAALEILLEVSSFHSSAQTGPSQPLPIDNEWLTPSAAQILSITKAIFDNPVDDGHLRSLSLPFLDLNQPAIVADVRRVYRETSSEELRFAIEDAFLKTGDRLYDRLNPPGGPIASVILAAPERGCVKGTNNGPVFVEKYQVRQAFLGRWGATGLPELVLTNLRTGRRFVAPFQVLSGSSGQGGGELWFELNQPIGVPAGDYSLAAEYRRNGETVSTGHRISIAIVRASGDSTVKVK